jgi:hypothetical protein
MRSATATRLRARLASMRHGEPTAPRHEQADRPVFDSSGKARSIDDAVGTAEYVPCVTAVAAACVGSQ